MASRTGSSIARSSATLHAAQRRLIDVAETTDQELQQIKNVLRKLRTRSIAMSATAGYGPRADLLPIVAYNKDNAAKR